MVTSFWPRFHAWFMPNSNTTSSRVLVTLQTLAYELFIAESSHLMRVPSAAALASAAASAFVAMFLQLPSWFRICAAELMGRPGKAARQSLGGRGDSNPSRARLVSHYRYYFLSGKCTLKSAMLGCADLATPPRDSRDAPKLTSA